MLVTVPKWYISKKIPLISTKKCRNTKRFVKISMIKNFALLTYNKSLWLWGTMIWVLTVFCSTCETIRTGSLRSKKKKKKPAEKKKQVFYRAISTVLIWSPNSLPKYQNRKLFRVTVSGDQNVMKHGENLGSKLTNHKMTKFTERSEVCLFSLQEALRFTSM